MQGQPNINVNQDAFYRWRMKRNAYAGQESVHNAQGGSTSGEAGWRSNSEVLIEPIALRGRQGGRGVVASGVEDVAKLLALVRARKAAARSQRDGDTDVGGRLAIGL